MHICYYNPPHETSSHKEKSQLISDSIFYLAVALCLVSAILWHGGEGGDFFGVRIFCVRTGSMQREISVGSLVFVTEANPSQIKKGTDITFLSSDGSVITHRVIEVIPNGSTGSLPAFRTKGLENPLADEETVYFGSVYGVVRAHIPFLGKLLLFTKENLPILIMFFGVLMLISFSLRLFLGKGDEDDTQATRGILLPTHGRKRIYGRH